MLLIGFESTTVIPAYFRCLSPSSVRQSAGPSQVPFPLVPPYAGTPLLRNTRKTVAVSSAPPEEQGSSSIVWRCASAPFALLIRYRMFN